MSAIDKSSPAFNDASAHNIAGEKTMALMIDIQEGCLCHMSDKEAQAYLEHLGKVLTDLRVRNIPIGWVTVGQNADALYPAEGGNTGPRGDTEIKKMRFFSADPTEKADMVARFLSVYGPRRNEVMFDKGNVFSALDAGVSGLRDHLKEKGVSKLVLSGAMAGFCVAHTARDSVLLGHQTVVDVRNLVGWTGDAATQKDFKAVWRGGDHVGNICSVLKDLSPQVAFVGAEQPPRLHSGLVL